MDRPSINIVDDGLRARVSLPAGVAVELGDLRSLVLSAGVRHGLEPERLVACTVPDGDQREVTVAKGTPARSRYRVHLREGLTGNGEAVQNKQVIGEIVYDEQVEPSPGMAVTGDPIDVVESPGSPLFGDGLEKRGELVVAKRDGIFVIEDDLMWTVVTDPRGRPKRDFMIFVADDDSSCWVRLEGGEYLPSEALQNALRAKEVVYGLDPSGINRAVEGVCKPTTIELARGAEPEHGRNGELQHLLEDRVRYTARQDGSLDFHESHLIKNVKAGTPVARISPASPGKPGMSVRGRRIEPRPGKEVDPETICEEGVVAQATADGGYDLVAANDGVCSRLFGGKVQVRPLILVEGDVDMRCGNIDTEFPVHVMGDIQSGFSVKSKADIQVDGSIEDARVSAQGNLQVREGILPGENRVKAHGDISARYIQGREIKARNISVHTTLRHCQVLATGEVIAQQVLGGHVIAAGDIIGKEFGDEKEQKTIIQSGVDPFRHAAYEEAKMELGLIEPALAQLKERMAGAIKQANDMAQRAAKLARDATVPKVLMQATNDARSALSQSKDLAAEYDKDRKRFEEFKALVEEYEQTASQSHERMIRATGAVHLGVELRIGRHAKLRLEKPHGAGRFHVEEGRITI